MEDRTPLLVLGVLILVGALLLFLFWVRKGAPQAPVPSPAPTATATAPDGTITPAAVPATAAKLGEPALKPAAKPKPVTEPKPVAEAGDQAPGAAPDGTEEAGEDWEFTKADIAASKRTVYLDLGDYRVKAGDEFDVTLVLESPPLTSLTLVLTYDKDLLEVVADSGKAVGRVFRRGMEFYTNAETGNIGIFNAALPGQKNMLAAKREKVATFKMRAKKAGATKFGFAENGVSFVNGLGEPEIHQVSGGSVVIE